MLNQEVRGRQQKASSDGGKVGAFRYCVSCFVLFLQSSCLHALDCIVPIAMSSRSQIFPSTMFNLLNVRLLSLASEIFISGIVFSNSRSSVWFSLYM